MNRIVRPPKRFPEVRRRPAEVTRRSPPPGRRVTGALHHGSDTGFVWRQGLLFSLLIAGIDPGVSIERRVHVEKQRYLFFTDKMLRCRNRYAFLGS